MHLLGFLKILSNTEQDDGCKRMEGKILSNTEQEDGCKRMEGSIAL